MTLDQLLETVDGSLAHDWHRLPVHTVYGWEHGQKEGQNFLEPKTHDTLLVYKPDIDISLALGATINDPFQEPWVQNFPDPHAVSVSVQLRYRGTVVFEWVYVIADGGREYLPLPKIISGGYQVSQHQLPLARVIFHHNPGSGHQKVEQAIAQAKLTIA